MLRRDTFMGWFLFPCAPSCRVFHPTTCRVDFCPFYSAFYAISRYHSICLIQTTDIWWKFTEYLHYLNSISFFMYVNLKPLHHRDNQQFSTSIFFHFFSICYSAFRYFPQLFCFRITLFQCSLSLSLCSCLFNEHSTHSPINDDIIDDDRLLVD